MDTLRHIKGFKFNVLSFLTKDEKKVLRRFLEILKEKVGGDNKEEILSFYFKKC